MRLPRLLLWSTSLVFAQTAPKLQIQSFTVSADQTLSWPSSAASGTPYLVDMPDEHTTFIPQAAGGKNYLVFGASKLSGGTGGAVVLATSDLVNFTFATSLGYARQVMAPPTAIDKCDPAYQFEFDGNYAAPGTVVQDPTLPAGNYMMFYEAENHCPGGVNQQPYYATVGFARSSDSGKTWPAPINGPSGGAARYPVLQSADPQPTASHPPLGNAIPSAMVDKSSDGNYYVYVVYGAHLAAPATNDGLIRIARAKLGSTQLTFQKWYNGAFSQPGIGGSDTGMTPDSGCGNGQQQMADISYNDDVGLYLLLFACQSGPTGSRVGAWYYSTATSLDREDWASPQMVANSQYPVTANCSADGQSGNQFDGWYPSTVSPGAASGHTKLTGSIFFQNGCDTGARIFASRSFTITTEPFGTPHLTSGTLANGATYAAGGLVPGSWAQVKGTNLSSVTRIWGGSDFAGLGNNLPTDLSGVQVSVNGTPAAVYYVSPGQVSFQVPNGVTGNASVQVTNNGLASATLSAPAAANAPGIFPVIVNGTNYAAGVFPDGKIVGDPTVSPAFRNAKPGDIIQLFATGLISTPAGVLPTAQNVSGVTVTLGGVAITPSFAGLVAVGEFQINFTVPQSFSNRAAANYPITIAVNGVSSPSSINTSPAGPVVVPIQP